ncbi:mitogen-activated protein kinase kinase [Talaromyces islandicus]|uniref:mitogen-activated protein kinase kinase n=1 Tax=Talaromyces islandicus TaxID=28573 RepID=A0A0U1M278_TALIS|nr:mitogen-activated protein kinase kinase [Talaromyces islandicus]
MDADQKAPIVEDVAISPGSDNEPQTPPSPAASAPTVTKQSGAAVPSLRPGAPGKMSESSNPLGQLNAARRGGVPPPRPVASIGGQSAGLNQDLMARMKEFSLSRQGAPVGITHAASTGTVPSANQGPASPATPGTNSPHGIPFGPIVGGVPGRGPIARPPPPPSWSSAPSVQPRQKPGGLAAKRLKPGLKLSDAQAPPINGTPPTTDTQVPAQPTNSNPTDSVFSKYSEFLDTKSGTLNFKNKAIIHGGGIEFSSGQSFSISLDEVDRLEELGKGNYGTVYKVRHSRPHLRKRGLGLSGIVSRPPGLEDVTSPTRKAQDNLTGVVMAMKEIRLELDEKKFAQIIMELEILHRCVSPFIIDFYGAFFQEGAVYICVEYMDGGSVDRLYKDGMPENILRKVALSTVMGLKTLKDDHNIIHRDVKPTNILANTRGQVKICDFGVSGNLVASIAKTNIGCQSYMAPERIAGGGMQQSGATNGGTYSVQSDIWSLGLSVIECARGRYPYPPETYNNIFSQLHEIVNGEPPTLPDDFSDDAHAFVRACLDKNPSNRPSYAQLLRHPWLTSLMVPPTATDGDTDVPEEASSQLSPDATDDAEVAAWVTDALERRLGGASSSDERPALHAAPLDAVGGSPLLEESGRMYPAV